MTDEIQKAPNKLLTTKNTDNEKLIWYLQGKLKRTDLSSKVEEKLDRIMQTSDLIRRYGSRMKVVPMLEKLFDISTPQAYRYFNDTQAVLATTEQHNQTFWVDILLGDIRENIKKAQLKGDYKSVTALIKIQKETIKELLGDADAAKYDELNPPVPVLGFFPEELKVKMPDNLDALINEFKKTKTKIPAVDVDHEEIE